MRARCSQCAATVMPSARRCRLRRRPDRERQRPRSGGPRRPSARITDLRGVLADRGFSTVPLPVAAAFHTPLVAHARHPFAKAIEASGIRAPSHSGVRELDGCCIPRPFRRRCGRSRSAARAACAVGVGDRGALRCRGASIRGDRTAERAHRARSEDPRRTAPRGDCPRRRPGALQRPATARRRRCSFPSARPEAWAHRPLRAQGTVARADRRAEIDRSTQRGQLRQRHDPGRLRGHACSHDDHDNRQGAHRRENERQPAPQRADRRQCIGRDGSPPDGGRTKPASRRRRERHGRNARAPTGDPPAAAAGVDRSIRAHASTPRARFLARCSRAERRRARRGAAPSGSDAAATRRLRRAADPVRGDAARDAGAARDNAGRRVRHRGGTGGARREGAGRGRRGSGRVRAFRARGSDAFRQRLGDGSDRAARRSGTRRTA